VTIPFGLPSFPDGKSFLLGEEIRCTAIWRSATKLEQILPCATGSKGRKSHARFVSLAAAESYGEIYTFLDKVIVNCFSTFFSKMQPTGEETHPEKLQCRLPAGTSGVRGKPRTGDQASSVGRKGRQSSPEKQSSKFPVVNAARFILKEDRAKPPRGRGQVRGNKTSVGHGTTNRGIVGGPELPSEKDTCHLWRRVSSEECPWSGEEPNQPPKTVQSPGVVGQSTVHLRREIFGGECCWSGKSPQTPEKTAQFSGGSKMTPSPDGKTQELSLNFPFNSFLELSNASPFVFSAGEPESLKLSQKSNLANQIGSSGSSSYGRTKLPENFQNAVFIPNSILLGYGNSEGKITEKMTPDSVSPTQRLTPDSFAEADAQVDAMMSEIRRLEGWGQEDNGLEAFQQTLRLLHWPFCESGSNMVWTLQPPQLLQEDSVGEDNPFSEGPISTDIPGTDFNYSRELPGDCFNILPDIPGTVTSLHGVFQQAPVPENGATPGTVVERHGAFQQTSVPEIGATPGTVGIVSGFTLNALKQFKPSLSIVNASPFARKLEEQRQLPAQYQQIFRVRSTTLNSTVWTLSLRM